MKKIKSGSNHNFERISLLITEKHVIKQFLKHIVFGGFLLSFAISLTGCTDSGQDKLDIKPESSIVFIGNTFAERMQLFGYFETFLHSQFPTDHLKIRNMGWPADEVALRPRPSGFGEMHKYLQDEKADIIFASYGFNESFKGTDSLQAFSKNLRVWLEDLKAHQYNGKSSPEIILISPMAHEALDKLPDGKEHNKVLLEYMKAMREVASHLKLRFVDLFTPTLAYFDSNEETKLTFNGVHLTAYGDWRVSNMLAESLFNVESISPPIIEDTVDNSDLLDLKRTVYDKNYTFLLHWRGPNMEYVHGSRNDAGGATGLAEEREQILNIVQQLDEKIWAAPKPKVEEFWTSFPSNKSLWVNTPSYEDIQIPEHLKEVSKEPLKGDEKTGQIASIDKALEGFHLPKGYEINLYASEQDFPLANPMAMNFDSKGRLWVANTPTWPQPKPGVQPEDFIVILDDTDKDGRADKHTIFAENLNMMHGFALGFDGVFISQTPNILFAKDTNGDDVADTYETILEGFGAEDAEHSINNFTWGPDGALYFTNGVFFHSQVETAYGPVRIKDAGMFRYEPRLQKLDPYISHFFYNPWGLAFDKTGQGLLLDASSGDFFNMSLMKSNFNYPKIKYSFPPLKDGPQEPAIHEMLSFAPEGVGPAAGAGLIENTHFPKEAQGRFISNQIEGWRGTHWFDLIEKGTNFEVKTLDPELIFSEDPHFRPIAVTFGPDGAMYIIDFYSPIFENVNFPKRSTGRDHSHGRIWRITYPSRPLLEYPNFDSEPIVNLLELLKKSDDSPIRFHARRELQERNTKDVIEQLGKWVANLDKNDKDYEHYLLEGLYIYEGQHTLHEPIIRELLDAKSAKIRAAATRIFRWWMGGMDDYEQLLKKLVNDDDMRVRLEAVIACGHSSSPSAYEIAAQAANHPMDDGMKNALDETLLFLKEQNPLKGQSLKVSATEELLDMPMSESVGRELLTRNDSIIKQSVRLEALTYLSKLNNSTLNSEIIKALRELDIARGTKIDDTEKYALIDLKTILLLRGQKELSADHKELVALASSTKSKVIKGMAYSAIVIADGNASTAWKLAQESETNLAILMEGIHMLPDDALKKSFYNKVAGQLKSSSPLLREKAILALADISLDLEKTNETLEAIYSNGSNPIAIRFAALNGLAKLSGNKGKNAITKIEIEVIPGILEYDIKEFTVSAGSPIEITFTNTGIMLHNMLIIKPGQLEFVGKAAEAMMSQSDALSKNYVPDIKEVLFSTPMVGPKKSFKLQFFAPETPESYPYVCTFPGHWPTMNGIMIVENS